MSAIAAVGGFASAAPMVGAVAAAGGSSTDGSGAAAAGRFPSASTSGASGFDSLLVSQGSPSQGLGQLEALAILALLAGPGRHHHADAMGAVIVALALAAYASVQAMGPPQGPSGGPGAAGAGLSLRA